MSMRAIVSCLLACAACGAPEIKPSSPPGVTASSITVTSPALPPTSPIPVDFTCDGKDRSPPLTWSAPPEGTKSLAIFVEDPDGSGGLFTHWIAFDVPGDKLAIPEAADLAALGAKNGMNDFKNPRWGGPCPPKHEVHRYVFRVFALNAPLGLPEGATREAVLRAMSGKVLGEGELVAHFSH
jgi:Raf kinase inhibitor-like YbhB/YbcL family protein